MEEAARLLDLVRHRILDTGPDERFERILRLAVFHFKVPMAAINLVDHERVWSKAAVGLNARVVPRDLAVCAWTILQDTPYVVADAQLDPRLCTHPVVTGPTSVRLYAGVPLHTSSGNRIGTLCVMDQAPRHLSEGDLLVLRDLGMLTQDMLALHALTARPPSWALN